MTRPRIIKHARRDPRGPSTTIEFPVVAWNALNPREQRWLMHNAVKAWKVGTTHIRVELLDSVYGEWQARETAPAETETEE